MSSINASISEGSVRSFETVLSFTYATKTGVVVNICQMLKDLHAPQHGIYAEMSWGELQSLPEIQKKRRLWLQPASDKK